MKVLLSLAVIFLLVVPTVWGQVEIDPEWVFRWFWVPEESDQGDAIVCDQFGNVYVGGHTDTSATHNDWVTVRISPDGDSVWTRIYDSPSDGIDQPEYIAVDDSGYIYVTGDCGMYSAPWEMDATVIKYDSLGNQIWVYAYNSPVSMDDRVEGFGLGNDGNIFVVGYTEITGGKDYLIIKLQPTGDTAWVRTLPTGNGTYDRLYDIAFDDSNYIYVTGGYTNMGNYDIATIKYNQNGDTLWMGLYNGPSSGSDVPVGIGIDDSGYVYVGGYTYNVSKDVVALKYDSDGNFIWAASYDGEGQDNDNPKDMTVDSDGNVYIVCETTMNSQRDFLVTKFNNTGALAWDFQYDAGGNDDEIVFNNKALIKVDGEGNVYFGGATYYVPVGLTLTNTMTFKLDSSGNIVWYNRYGGPGNDFDQIRAVTLDDEGNCYVTGYSDGIYDNWDLFVLKFSAGISPNPGFIAGVIKEQDDVTPIADVEVSVYDSVDDLVGTDTTDLNGEFDFTLDPGTYYAMFSKTGYIDTTLTDINVVSDETTHVSLIMYPSGCDFTPGDANGDGSVMGNDVTYGVRYFKGLGNPPPDSCEYDGGWLYSAGDANGNCQFAGSDITFLVAYFKGYNPEILWCPQTPPIGQLSQDASALGRVRR